MNLSIINKIFQRAFSCVSALNHIQLLTLCLLKDTKIAKKEKMKEPLKVMMTNAVGALRSHGPCPRPLRDASSK